MKWSLRCQVLFFKLSYKVGTRALELRGGQGHGGRLACSRSCSWVAPWGQAEVFWRWCCCFLLLCADAPGNNPLDQVNLTCGSLCEWVNLNHKTIIDRDPKIKVSVIYKEFCPISKLKYSDSFPALSCHSWWVCRPALVFHTLQQSAFQPCYDLNTKLSACSWLRVSRLIGEGNGNPLQYSCLENSMDREAWRATVCGVAKSRTRLSD